MILLADALRSPVVSDTAATSATDTAATSATAPGSGDVTGSGSPGPVSSADSSFADSIPSAVRVTVVGIGADGWAGLAPTAREVVRGAAVLFGADRQLALVPERIDGQPVGGRRVSWPSPLLPALPRLLAGHAGTGAQAGQGELCVLASGDPMFFGIGTTLVRLLGAHRVRVLPHPSSLSLACARLGWAVDDVDVVSAVGRPLAQVQAALAPRRRLLVLSSDRATPVEFATLLVGRGYGESLLTVLDRLGGPDEAYQSAPASAWVEAGARAWVRAPAAVEHPGGAASAVPPGSAVSQGSVVPQVPLREPADLNVVAVEPVPTPSAPHRSRTPGLPDDAFEHDGQITRREIRAVTLARLGPVPGELLWDVGSGSGSIAIEWMRTHGTCRAIAIEPRAERADRIRRNATALGVPALRIVPGRAPEALAGLPAPDAVFIGGGLTTPGLLDACWAALGGRGRLVANAVTLESEALLVSWHARLGGDLVRLSVSRAAPIGGFTGWRPARPVTQWTVWPAAHRSVDPSKM
ncbi:precorrin-6Y C5,15-methyltransferase (decarboxylating) [Frankia casuarinae]|nr:precorrin-6Y C5,15-methyltransferase (decarboxylating) [Frankia sp. CcI6]EYT91565.1 precorrin-6Y C5,15-methyltransferase (decarboxylating) [Frankia casuarinae]KDA44845.1 precorrin-6Y C5,15-methyltransferase (decarboxylating) [Frankia sp. BMG5.23]OAA24780.1 precorrin-6Y C5,15-methyltransferase (decarboxylating) [Frankia casuarinae]